ncbi:MAG TPA: AsmA family protein, partial [Bacteroidales bacterium]|nr:AsmA family protein [Bacteroidales bacterium]
MKIYPLLAQKVVVQQILLAGADININQKGSEFNFDDIIKKFSSNDSTPQPEDTTASKWEISLNNITIKQTNITYKDLELNSTWALEDFALNIPSMYFDNKSSDIGINLKFKNGG